MTRTTSIRTTRRKALAVFLLLSSMTSTTTRTTTTTTATTIDDDDILNLMPSTPTYEETPSLSGRHFRITCVEHVGYLDIVEDSQGNLSFSGYLISILEELSREDRGNFTYELLPPSGFGSKCHNRLTTISSPPNVNTTSTGNNSNTNMIIIPDEISVMEHPEAYHSRNYGAFQCGESDVNDRPLSGYSTDLYVSSFYITPDRLMSNHFTVPYSPPDRATLGMVGTATNILNIPDLAANNHKYNYQICAFENTAYMDTLMVGFPTLDIKGISYAVLDLTILFDDRSCDILIASYPELSPIIQYLYDNDECLANNGKVRTVNQSLLQDCASEESH